MTKEIKKKLLRNGDVTNRGNDHKPVVKLFGGSSFTWLITEMDSVDDDTMFGLCDLGMGYPELGYVSLAELESMKFPPFGLGVERDLHFKADKPLSHYTKLANQNQRIVA
jgi:hypothetical protein